MRLSCMISPLNFRDVSPQVGPGGSPGIIVHLQASEMSFPGKEGYFGGGFYGIVPPKVLVLFRYLLQISRSFLDLARPPPSPIGG